MGRKQNSENEMMWAKKKSCLTCFNKNISRDYCTYRIYSYTFVRRPMNILTKTLALKWWKVNWSIWKYVTNLERRFFCQFPFFAFIPYCQVNLINIHKWKLIFFRKMEQGKMGLLKFFIFYFGVIHKLHHTLGEQGGLNEIKTRN